MRNIFLSALLVLVATGVLAQEKAEEGFTFTTVKENPITSVKNQSRSGTCWAFSTLGYFESELLRLGKGEYDLNEMFLAHKTYEDRAVASVRMHGDISFSEGGSSYDAVYCMRNYGMVPQEAMPVPGSLYDSKVINFQELFSIAEPYVEAIAKGHQKSLSPIWNKGLVDILDEYLGKVPETFTYKGKEYTPKSFQASLGLNLDDYVSLTSFTHHPFYEKFIIEVQDNWRWDASYNIPIDELMEVMDSAVRQGYTFAWGADVSEEGFTRDGIAVCPDMEKAQDLTGSDMAHWVGAKPAEKKEMLTRKPLPEIEVTQEMRQKAYDNWETTDDHGMLIYGIAKDQNGKEYFMVKNSWGESGKYKGIWYASKTFAKYKTLDILINRNAIPRHIREKLHI